MSGRSRRRGVAGRMYIERGRPVLALVGWAGRGPRNVLILRWESGELVVRPFRGLRRPRPQLPCSVPGSRGAAEPS
ncbi:hypothetical protein HS041_10545 [Planomonospora sp. ID67723]|uniref:hypothetical protein n=1 Tax=Planomonospora sp. ID67723 TaxID=2738134 RepID=UPI0018C3A6A6|nr:hypothetical protein [Planomonospora sp. ID67723]MBG0828206.1 hypothetical protein [Planomonospora sp. ID67723]